MNMPIDAFLTTLYVIVDDWYQTNGPRLLAGKAGAKPRFSDSEVITLSVAQHWCGFATEREWLRFVRQNHPDLFPHLVSQSEFNVRARNLCWVIRELGQWAIKQMGVRRKPWRLVDGTPIPTASSTARGSACGTGGDMAPGRWHSRRPLSDIARPSGRRSMATGWLP